MAKTLEKVDTCLRRAQQEARRIRAEREAAEARALRNARNAYGEDPR